MKPSRRTITTPSRFTISTRNWLVNSVALFCTLLFFFSCTDDAALVGFPKAPRLATRYVEIPLDYSLILRQPQGTQNFSDDAISRLLVGRTMDPDLGEIEATAFFNFAPPIDNTVPVSAVEFVSLELVLKFDYYSFGPTDSTELELAVHELTETLTSDNFYDSRTSISYNPVPIGDTIISPGPVMLKTGWELASDNNPTNNIYFTQSIKLPNSMGESLLDDLINDRTTIEDFRLFSTKYPGFAVKMPSGNKILGFTPVYSLPTPSRFDSRVVLTFKENGVTATRDFPIYFTVVDNLVNFVTSFTQLNEVRTGTPLDGILPLTDFHPSNGMLYAQSGVGLMPKFDFSKVYDYFDTIPYAVINLAEMKLDNTYLGRTPQDLEFLLLDSLNQFRPVKVNESINGALTPVDDPYLLKIREGIIALGVGTETRVAALNQLTGQTVAVDQSTGKVGATIFTEFFQQIISNMAEPNRATAFALHPVENEFNKSVSLLKLNPSSAILKVYYSVPTTAPINTSP